MRFSAKIEYASRATLELARCYSAGKAIRVEEIADAQNIPKKFLLHILLRLSQSGIVRSVRGIGGGYMLSRHPSQITLLEVVQGIDRSIGDDSDVMPQREASPISSLLSSVWAEANSRVADTLSVSLEALLSRIESAPIVYEI